MKKDITKASSPFLKYIKRVVVDKNNQLKLLDSSNTNITHDNYYLIDPPTYILFNDNHIDKLKRFFA